MVDFAAVWRFNTRSMMTVIALIGLGCGLLVWSWRNVWGPWPRWVRLGPLNCRLPGHDHCIGGGSRGPRSGCNRRVGRSRINQALDDPNEGTRVAAIIALGQAGPRAAEAVPKLLALLRDQPLVEYHAACALGQIVGQNDAERDAVVSALFTAVAGPFPRTPVYAMVRAYSIQSISRLVEPEGRSRADLDRLLTRSLGDDYPLVRAIAGLELIRLGRGDDATSCARGNTQR